MTVSLDRQILCIHYLCLSTMVMAALVLVLALCRTASAVVAYGRSTTVGVVARPSYGCRYGCGRKLLETKANCMTANEVLAMHPGAQRGAARPGLGGFALLWPHSRSHRSWTTLNAASLPFRRAEHDRFASERDDDEQPFVFWEGGACWRAASMASPR